MYKFFKGFLAVISIVILVFLINISFFSSAKTDKEDLLFLQENKKSQDFESQDEINTTSIDFLDNIFHLKKDSFDLETKWKNLKIDLKDWSFILDLNDLSKTYKIESKKYNFSIDLKWIWSFYIENKKDRVTIFSINSSLVLNFLDDRDSLVNSYFLYPHEFIKFNNNQNSRYRNVDLYRIRTITKNGYFQYKLLADNGEKSKISLLVWDKNSSIFKYYTNYKKNLTDSNNLVYNKINSIKIPSFPFSYYIEKYYQYFINEKKKLSYLQNNLYNKLIKLFKSKVEDSNFLMEIESDLEKLKSLDEEKHKNILSLIDEFYKVLVLKNDIEKNKILSSFLELRSKESNLDELENYINLKNIYFNYDFLISDNLGQYFSIFLDWYLAKSWIKEENENFTLNKKEKLSEIEAFVFFLREYIYANSFSDKIENIESDVYILSKYINLNKMIYFSGKTDATKIKTSLTQNLKILQNLEWYLKNNFFEDEREENTDLLLLNQNKVNYKFIIDFENQVNKIFKLLQDNVSILEKAKSYNIIDEYKKLSISLEEKLFALWDYDNYKLENNKELKELYDLTTFWYNSVKQYNKLDIVRYLLPFEWLDFSIKNITKSGSVFDIKNISILWKPYTMSLDPYAWNIVKIFDDKSQNMVASYNLSEMKMLLDERLKWAWEEEKYKYEFKNFFVERFKIWTDKKSNSSYDKCYFENKVSDWMWGCKDMVQDSPAITVIKRDKLIWQEFRVIKDFFKIKYEDLYVTVDWWDAFIEILKASINSSIKKWTSDKKYIAEMRSLYDLENHEFYDISFKIKEDKEKGSYLYDGAKFEFGSKRVYLTNLKNFVSQVLSDIEWINKFYSPIRSDIILSNAVISYDNWYINLKFDNGWKNVSMKTKDWKIESIEVNWKEILDFSIEAREVSKILNKLK